MSETLAPGAALAHYRIVSRIGAGGMGEVYLAQDTRLDRTVALKVLPAEFAADQQRLRRFVQEAKAASAINHPNVATIYEIGDHQSLHFIAMEYVEGQPLTGRRLETAELLRVAVQAAEALEEAHSKGVTHRDVKPANIMLTARGQVKVLDFGLAKLNRPREDSADAPTEAAATDPGLIMGTVQYMSPEQALGKPVDPRTDIFSIGVVLYEMATGRLPFPGTSPTDTIDRILHAQPAEGTQPAELDRIIRKCMEKDRERRYQSARELGVDLKNLQRDSGAAPAAAAPPPRASRRALWLAPALGVVVLAVGLYWFYGRRPAIDSVAVLPFANAGANPEMEYLSDGLTEGLIDSLSQLPNLKVRSRNLVFRFKGKEGDAQKAGRELGVPVVLTGRVTERGDNLSIRVELIDVADNNQLWGQSYNRKLADVLAVQAEISREVTERLRLRLEGQEQRQLSRRPTVSPEAYQLYLQGRYHLNKRTADGHKKAVEYFEQALAKDPGYARAYSGLADAYAYLGFDSVLPPKEAMPKALAAARQALALDEALAETHVSLAMVKRSYEWDWTGAEREFQRAIELNANYAEAHHMFAMLLSGLGRHDQAIVEIKRAVELEPFNLHIQAHAGWALTLARRYDEAAEQFRKTLDMDPNFAHTYLDASDLYEETGKYGEAIAAIKKGIGLAGGGPNELAWLGRAYARAGKKGEARKVLHQLTELGKRQYISAAETTAMYAALGERDIAFQWLEKALEERSPGLVWLRQQSAWDPLRSDPRFASALRRMGLAP